MSLFQYRARVHNIVDGDTLDLEVDLGFRMTMRDRFRLHGINAPEPRGETREAGKAATDAVREVLRDAGLDVTVQTHRDSRGKYGRWLADVVLSDGRNLNHWLVENGYAEESE